MSINKKTVLQKLRGCNLLQEHSDEIHALLDSHDPNDHDAQDALAEYAELFHEKSHTQIHLPPNKTNKKLELKRKVCRHLGLLAA